MKWRYSTIPECIPRVPDCPDYVYLDPCTISYKGRTLKRITALENNELGFCAAGRVGGFVEKDTNLSQFHAAWIDDCAVVMDDAVVSEQALVFEDAEVMDTAKIFSNAKVAGKTSVTGSQWVNNDMNEGVLRGQQWVCK